ncbi:MAG: AAA family ATPase [Halofilum sp. (in: g-proteobacteria)]
MRAQPGASPIFGQYALPLAALGYAPLPLYGKRPILARWQFYEPERLPALIESYPNANVGLRTAELAALDADVLNPFIAKRMRQFVIKLLGLTRKTCMVRVGQKPKWLLLLRYADGERPKRSSPEYEDAQGKRHRLEWLCTGQQFLAFGTHPDTHKPVTWLYGSPLDANVRVNDLPVVTAEQMDAIEAEFARLAELSGWRLTAKGGNVAHDAPVTKPVKGLDLAIVQDVLAHYPNDDLHYDEWLSVGMALHHQFQGDTAAFDLWHEWSTGSVKCGDVHYNWHRWESFDHERPGGLSMRSVLAYAEENGWERPAGVEQAPAAADDFPELDPLEPEPGELKSEAALVNAPQTDAADQTDGPQGDAPGDKPKRTIDDLFPGALDIPLGFDPMTLPRRDWLIPGRLLAGHVALLFGPPGVAKSMFDLTLVVSVITGRPLLGIKPARTGPVVMFNNEDPYDELRRRVLAICTHHNIPLEEVMPKLRLLSGYVRPYKFAEAHGNRHQGTSLRPTREATKLIAGCQDFDAVAVFMDPLISTVRGGDENSNDRMEELVSIYKRIAVETGCAISVTHHTRKVGGRDSEGHAGDMETARGGGALMGAVRLGYTLSRSSPETGKKWGLPRSVSKNLYRIDSAKQNYFPPDDEADWYQLVSTPIGNGEEVGVPEPVALEELQRQYADPDDLSLETMDLHARRRRLAGMFALDTADGECAWGLKQVAERWAGFAICSTRTAQEQIKSIVPEGGVHHAVVVEYDGVEYLLWREIKGEGKSSRQTVYIVLEQGCNSDELDWTA